jgi:SnoaL-like protein
VNAVERLWRAIGERDWAGAADQFLPNAQVLWPHTGERLTAAEYVALNRAYPGRWAAEVQRIVGDGNRIAAEVRVTGGEETYVCAGFYDLHQARIAGAVEYWVQPGAEKPPPDRRP